MGGQGPWGDAYYGPFVELGTKHKRGPAYKNGKRIRFRKKDRPVGPVPGQRFFRNAKKQAEAFAMRTMARELRKVA